ncbi:MAG: peptide chain release factor N(5)-glutamine methyltransferase [Candidatus Omnitrophica bacterium]|nr:peptide chain release factor N(5)-glutamine methyltransferase [Candidatus Omnitrophota bacterium]MDD5512778.1 peptide chain release factor N(5)-glutamine methyltransferase [Candidatus Omnitrophota bacterium]
MNEAELLFSETLKCDRVFLYQNRSLRLNKQQSLKIGGALRRRMRAEPIQYILGSAHFMGLEFKVTPEVLIPRPETEILVETAIKLISSGVLRPSSFVDILDLGTGSGCIAVSLAKMLPQARVSASDISQEALKVARINACLHKVDSRINFILSDLFSHDAIRTTQYDLIVSNPPYIPAGEVDRLQPEIAYEPRLALEAGKDGLDFYRRIIPRATGQLKQGGALVLEIGFEQKQAIVGMIEESRGLSLKEVIRDYQGIERIVVAEKQL